ncbi:hypothetical protein HPB50_026553 [Hyalomma asiaticum]|uniref:Uncharacterized protein n=1 Tax=Hyalomma asiaticum TaxID=266040 RepID=A0ACB7TTN5_HYAAI|nr:hypothetical protein HPB50_026553 [Hyalomma asiaticum]
MSPDLLGAPDLRRQRARPYRSYMDVVEVEGEDLRPEDFGEGAGWCHVKKTRQPDGASESAQKQQLKTQQAASAASTTGVASAATTAAYNKRKYARQLQHLAKASRMPELPPDNNKIIVRPREYCSGYNISTGGNGGHYSPEFYNHSGNDNRRGLSTSRNASDGGGTSRSRSRSRTPRPRSTSKTRGGATPGAAASNHHMQQSQQQQTWRQPQQQGHLGNAQQVRWSDVAAFPTGGVASAGRPRGPAVGGGGGSELEQAIERALEQRLRPLQSIITELKRENAILKAENSKLKGEASRPQQPPQQVVTPPPPAPRCSTPSRPEAAGMDTDDASSSWEGADGNEDRPCTAKRIALDPARHETDRRGGRYEKLQKQIDTIENSLDERFAKQAAQMNDMFNGAIAKLSEQMTQMLTAHMARIEN